MKPQKCRLWRLHERVLSDDVVYVENIFSHRGSINHKLEGLVHFYFCPECGIDLMYYRTRQQVAKERGVV